MTEPDKSPAEMEDAESPQRRRFLDLLSKGFLSMWGIGFLWVATHFIKPPHARSDLSERVIRLGPIDSIPVGGARLVQHGRDPIWVVRTDAETFVGLSGVCTHLRCILGWDGEEQSLTCPCHDGAFDLNGNVTKGPPPRSLPRYEVRTQLGEIYLHV